jgi:hypothetical protein
MFGFGHRGATRVYGWRDIASVLAVHALLFQIGLQVIAGLAAGPVTQEGVDRGLTLAEIAAEICSPAGLLESDRETRAPHCPGCLTAQPVLPTRDQAGDDAPGDAVCGKTAVADHRIASALDRLTTLNPRAPPLPV